MKAYRGSRCKTPRILNLGVIADGMRGHLHVLTVLNLRKELLYALDRTLGGPRDALIMMEERKIVVLAGNPTPETQSVTSHFAD